MTGGRLQFRVLGPFEVLRDGEPAGPAGAKRRALLAMLALRANYAVPVEDLIAGLWADDPPLSAANLVQTYVSTWRKTVEPERASRGAGDRLVTVGPGYRLRVEPGELDLDQFTRAMDGGQCAADATEHSEAAARLAEALGLWRGPPLAELAGLPFHRAAADRLEELRLQALEAWAAAALRAGSRHDVLAAVQDARGREPLRERLSELLMWALFQDGRQGEALATYDQTRRVLAGELGADPGAGLRDMHARVLRQDPTLRPTAPPSRLAQRSGPGRCWRRRVGGTAAVAAGVRSFAGRAGELKMLDELLGQAGGPGGTVVISAIAGTGGVGKTALAVHWAHLVADRFPDGQLYMNLRGFDPSGAPVSPAEAVRGFLDGFGVPPERIPVSPEAQTGLYRSLAAGKRLLIVLDNANDPGQVRPLLPGSADCLVLVTSRSAMVGLAVAEGAHPVRLDVLSEDESVQLLAARLGSERLAEEPEALRRVVGLCAGLPLALAITAARAAARPGLPLAALAGELGRESDRLDAFDTGEEATSVRAVFSWSYRQLTESAARMFRLLGLHPGPDINLLAAASLAGLPVRATRRALAELTAASLLSEHVPGRYALHDLLRAYAAEQARQIETADERRAAIRRALDHYLHTGRPGHPVV